jgi:hypothetical protein
MPANPMKPYPAGGTPPLEKHHPSVHPDAPTAVDADGRFNPAFAGEQRHASGGLSDDPTESGEPVRERRSFKITHTGSR